ncbi:MAG: hypothetical protein AAF621_04140 [Pseudomonadota bacterium]
MAKSFFRFNLAAMFLFAMHAYLRMKNSDCDDIDALYATITCIKNYNRVIKLKKSSTDDHLKILQESLYIPFTIRTGTTEAGFHHFIGVSIVGANNQKKIRFQDPMRESDCIMSIKQDKLSEVIKFLAQLNYSSAKNVDHGFLTHFSNYKKDGLTIDILKAHFINSGWIDGKEDIIAKDRGLIQKGNECALISAANLIRTAITIEGYTKGITKEQPNIFDVIKASSTKTNKPAPSARTYLFKKRPPPPPLSKCPPPPPPPPTGEELFPRPPLSSKGGNQGMHGPTFEPVILDDNEAKNDVIAVVIEKAFGGEGKALGSIIRSLNQGKTIKSLANKKNILPKDLKTYIDNKLEALRAVWKDKNLENTQLPRGYPTVEELQTFFESEEKRKNEQIKSDEALARSLVRLP